MLNEAQRRFIALALVAPIAWLWGPPGTGKTWTLTALVEALRGRSERVLVLSNTNKAVDQVLLALCRRIGRDHPAIVRGEIVRVGRLVHPELEREWADAVVPEKIAERLSAELRGKAQALRAEQTERKGKRERLTGLLEPLRQRDAARQTMETAARRAAAAIETTRQTVVAEEEARVNLERIRAELAEFDQAGWLHRLVMRDRVAIEAAIATTEDDLVQKTEARRQAQKTAEVMQAEARTAKDESDRLDNLTAGLDLEEAKARLKAIEGQLAEIAAQLATLLREIDEIVVQVVAKAKIVGATVTKTFLSPVMFAGFDAVILDEASMILLPACYHAAGLAQNRVVVSGDFRQLPPILPTETVEIMREIGGDIFERAGVTRSIDAGIEVPNLVMLTDQWRYPPAICDLVSRPMYGGRLRTALKRERSLPLCPAPYDKPITIVDTTDIGALAVHHLSRRSRINLGHALVMRNLVRHLVECGAIQEPKHIGLISPYAAQAEILANTCRDLGVEIDCGTVHRFQGDERDVIVLDLTEAPGEADYLGRPMRGGRASDAGARLINVALTRARKHLILVTHVGHFLRHAGLDTMIRRHLDFILRHHHLVPAPHLLSLYPPELPHIEVPPDGIFDEATFYAALDADIMQAVTYIEVYSAFMTLQRVAKFEFALRGALARGVLVRCITRPPQSGDMPATAKADKALQTLETWGVVVDLRHAIHQKAVLIDDTVVAYFGSLNPLSATQGTRETMLRFGNPRSVTQLREALAIPGLRRKDEEAATVRENPPCPDCSGRTIFHAAGFSRATGRAYDAFWRCESCDWRKDHRAFLRQAGRQTNAH
jgi:AAA domain/PLD-like domain